MTIYLYVKTHLKTGMKYLGKTENDPFVYKGSGKKWKSHINKHGNDVWTNVIFQSDSKKEIRAKGILFSEKWNVVISKEWANLKTEEGDGGPWKHSEETLKIMSEKASGEKNSMFGAERTDEWKKQHSEFMKIRFSEPANNPMFQRKHTKDAKEKMKVNVGKHWYNDGKTSILCFSSEIPEGFVKGRLLNHKKSK